jgi:peptidoglycan hydrolase-like protein with peptidoglycan-binding domain
MNASVAAELAARDLLEAPQNPMDPGAVASAAVADHYAARRAAAPRTTAQRGRTGKVSWDPSKHKRGYHGRFAAGGGGAPAEQQRQLHDAGLYHGAIDAQHGPQTQAAIKALQQRYGIKPTGKMDASTAAVLRAPPPKTAAQVAADDARAAAAAAPKTKSTRGGKTKRSGRQSGGTATSPGSASWQGQLSMTGVIRRGDGAHTKHGKDAARGSAQVQQLQAKLEQLGFDLGDAGPDGKFGPATERALKAFQRQYGLSADGVAGRHTKLLLNLLSEMEGQPNPNALSIDQMPLSRQTRTSGGKAGAKRQLAAMGVQQAAAVAEAEVRNRLRP